jgi:hypothetical protein
MGGKIATAGAADRQTRRLPAAVRSWGWGCIGGRDGGAVIPPSPVASVVVGQSWRHVVGIVALLDRGVAGHGSDGRLGDGDRAVDGDRAGQVRVSEIAVRSGLDIRGAAAPVLGRQRACL